MTALPQADDCQRRRVRACFAGRVQGVGFRPFVYRLAGRMGIGGRVYNAASGAVVEAEGPGADIDRFLAAIERGAPAPCRLLGRESMVPADAGRFEIHDSKEAGARPALATPDLAPCRRCLAELDDPADPRYRYPFIACTDCGPRYSVLESLPFDRGRTTMRAFPLRGRCEREYREPSDRRFHAEMIAAPDCGPRLAWWKPGDQSDAGEAALQRAADLVRGGGILALKGVGGFQLLCDARDEQAVGALRARKGRAAKPLAVMVAGLAQARALCRVDEIEAGALASPEAPVVLLARCPHGPRLAPSLAPGLDSLGVMLPASPLHLLLGRELGFPVVCTSGNVSGEPLCTGNAEALERLGAVADGFLLHDRDIARPLDDSVVRVIGGRPVTLRLGRGLAPLPLVPALTRGNAGRDLLALGAHVKAAPALLTGGHVVLGPHVGDLETEPARAALARAADDLETLFGARAPDPGIVCDAHPDYASTRLAERRACSPVRVWHHHAHVLACQLDNENLGQVLGVCWDGTGLGPDGTLWGGEFLRVDGAGFQRAAHLRAFTLPGGVAAIREPLRVAASLLHATFGDDLPRVGPFEDDAVRADARLWRQLSGPTTTSAGRLFDAVAALLGLARVSHYEGEPAMRLEAVVSRGEHGVYETTTSDSGDVLIVDWAPLVRAVVRDLEQGRSEGVIAARFHAALATCIATVARRLGARRAALTGGCFQNRVLCEAVIERLRHSGIEPLWHRRIPPNDGGIAAGQALAAWYTEEVDDVSGSSR